MLTFFNALGLADLLIKTGVNFCFPQAFEQTLSLLFLCPFILSSKVNDFLHKEDPSRLHLKFETVSDFLYQQII